MVDASVVLLKDGPSALTSRGQESRNVGLYRFRKPLVAAVLVSGDLVAALAAISFSDLSIGLTGLEGLHFRPGTALLVILALFLVGLYAGSGPSPYERFRKRALAVAGFTSLDFLGALPVAAPGGFLLAESWQAVCLLLFGHYIEALTRSWLIHIDMWGASTVLVGCGEDSRKLAHALMRRPDLGLTPVGFVQTSEERGMEMVQLPLPVIGTMADLSAAGPNIEVAIFASAEELAAVTCRSPACAPSCRFLLVEDSYNIQSLWLHTRTLDVVIGIEIRRDLCMWHVRMLKRMLDLLFAVPIALLVWPILMLLALAIKFIDPGPAFYVQNRVGCNGATARIVKLRTMYADAERRLEDVLSRDPQARAEWQRFFKLSRDPRVLPIIGNFMRRASLDELPQLWNVIRGDMSLVGPRPLPSYHADKFDAEFQAVRLSVRPGITGLWQISSRSDGDLQALREQDLFYIRNWSLWLDFYILLQTIPAVLSARGAR